MLPTDKRHREGRAFATICSHLPADGLPNAGGISAVITVNVDYDTLTGALGPGSLPSGARVPAATVRQLACTGGIIPQVLGGESLPLDLGRTQRLFTAAQRRALAHRDGGCIYPGCDRPPAWCEAHHWRNAWWPTNPGDPPGESNLRDGCLLCAEHHRTVHDRAVQIRERNEYLELLVPPSSRLQPRDQYGGDLLSGADESSDRARSGLVWQRNHRWRP